MRRGLSRHSNKSSGNFFSPIALFAGGVNGVWYDPSDPDTLFSDTAGTTPSPTPGAGALSVVGKMLDKSGNGNHAISYNTTTARPELSARVNLLTYSEDFSNAAWLTFGGASKISANAIRLTSAGTASNVYQQFTAAETNASSYVFSVEVMRNAGSNQTFQLFSNIRGTQQSSGNLTATDTWQRFSITGTYSSGATGSVFGIIGNTAGTQADLLVRNADLRPANIGTSVPAYQRIADQYTYDSSGFPRYLVFNGTASGMYTPANLNLSGTDKATVFAGVRKLSDAAGGVFAELSNNFNNNANTFAVFIPNGANTQVASALSNGSGLYNIAYYTDSAAPLSTVNSTAYNKALTTDQVVFIRKNGADQTLTRSLNNNTGNANFGSYPLNIGCRSATATPSVFFNGWIYSLIVVGAASTAAQISSTESWINVKEGGVY